MLFRKKKKFKVPKHAFDHPYKHRFTFVPKGCTYYEGYDKLYMAYSSFDKINKKLRLR